MTVFRSIVFAAVLSGLLVGCFATIAQHIATVPLIMQAEVYEQQSHSEEHEDEGWQPASGFERNTYTALFNLVDWIGFALLLEQGRAAEAEVVYREDLGLAGSLPRAQIHPDNLWALRGLLDCLDRRGEAVESPLIRQRTDLAAARADLDVAVSCFCARGKVT